MISLLLLVIFPYQVVLSKSCNGSCPSEKPYCSEVGCVFECPEPFYINGSNCVSDCGEMFVDENRKCTGACPEETFYKETLKQSVLKTYLERKCVKCIAQNLLISNVSCVNVCPSESRNIEENNCVSKCSDDRPFKINTTLYGLLHFECTSKCPVFEDNGYCAPFCPTHKVDFNRSCHEQCPKKSPFRLHNSCRSQCPDYAPAIGHYDKSCSETNCPDERPFVFNNTCEDSCPENFPVINSTFKDNKGFRYCLRECGDKYRFKNNCVDVCPSETFAVENICEEECPTIMPFMCTVAVGSKCGERSVVKRTHDTCLIECPQSMLNVNKTCVFSCQSVQAIYANDCIENCPVDRPYIFNNTCVENCPDNFQMIRSTFNNSKGFRVCLKDCGTKYRFNGYCLDACPPLTVAVENTCVKSCPMYTSYICIVAVGSKCGETTVGKLAHTICVNECPLNMVIWNDTCMSSCPSGLSIFGNECTENCPPDSPYHENKTSNIDCFYRGSVRYCKIIKHVLTCVQECASENYIYKNLCLQTCPENFLYSGMYCVSVCPKAEPYIENSTIAIAFWSYTWVSHYYYSDGHHGNVYEQKKGDTQIRKCVANCDARNLRLNFTCVKSCPYQHAINENGTCFKGYCDTQYNEVTKVGIVCLDKCRPNTFSLNNTCVDTCTGTNMTFHFNGTCVEKCPQGFNNMATSITNEVERDRYWEGDILVNTCTKDCGDEYFQYNGTCVNFCQPPLLTFENTCFHMCPLNAPFYMTSSVLFTKRSFEKDSTRFQHEIVNKTILRCEVKCPNNTVSLGLKCVHRCPLSRRFVINGSCQSDGCNTKYRFYHSSGIKCYDECPKDLFISNSTCTIKCLDHQYVFNQECVEFCPPTHVYIDKKYFPKKQFVCGAKLCTKTLISVRECRESCPGNKFLHNYECKNICPEDTVAHTNKCIEVCPPSHRNVEKKYILISKWYKYGNVWERINPRNYNSTECVFQCSEKHPFQFRNSCLSNCPGDFPYMENNKCVETCPSNKLTDLKTKVCVDECAQITGEFNNSCYNNCPKHIKYIFAARCVSECPSSYPVALREDRFLCRKSCEDSKLFKDGKCVYSFECDDPMFEYNGLCLHRCPEGLVWLFPGCINTLPAKVAIGILVMLLVLLFLITGRTILDFIRTVRLFFMSEERIKEKEQQLINSNLKSKLNGERKVLEDEIELLPNMVDETIL